MSFKIDLKDKRILHALDLNARSPLSKIAKLAGVSKQVVAYRLKQIEKNGLIETYFALIDVSKLGYTLRKAFVKLHNCGEKEEKKLITSLKNNPNVAWVVSCDGKFDLVFGMRARNIEEYALQLSKIENRFGNLFLDVQIAPIVKGQYFTRQYLINEPADSIGEFSFGSVPIDVRLDDLDWCILVEIGKNARKSFVEMARNLKVSPDVVRKRLSRLEKAGIVRKYIVILNNAVMSQQHFKLLLKLRNMSVDRFDSLIEYCHSQQNVIYLVKTFGNWEFEVDLEVADVVAFRDFLRKIKQKFADVIKDYDYINISKIHKYNFCPSKPIVNL